MPSLELAQWLWRRRFFLISSMYFRFFIIISLWKKTGPFIWTNLNPLHPRMHCTKSSWFQNDKITLWIQLYAMTLKLHSSFERISSFIIDKIRGWKTLWWKYNSKVIIITQFILICCSSNYHLIDDQVSILKSNTHLVRKW